MVGKTECTSHIGAFFKGNLHIRVRRAIELDQSLCQKNITNVLRGPNNFLSPWVSLLNCVSLIEQKF